MQLINICDGLELGNTLAPRRAVLITHPVFSTPGFGQNHPLSITRHRAFLELCQAMNWTTEHVRHAPLAERSTLKRFHTVDYLDVLERSARDMLALPEERERYNIGTMECPLFEGLWERACASVGGSILAADLALKGYLPFHPGGGTHHGKPDRASGFCYFNDPVFAILHLLDAGLQRVLYIDLDAHHGDGVESAFSDNERVYLVSLHEEGRWPGTGRLEDEVKARTTNIPLPRGTNDDEFLAIFRELYSRYLAQLHPNAVVITCGADALEGDPLSSMNVSNQALCDVVRACSHLCNITVVLGGGGYNPWTTARFWARLWAQLNNFDIPQQLPQAAQQVLQSLSCDLIDREDIAPLWLSSLTDRDRTGQIRDCCLTRAKIACGLLKPTTLPE